MRRSLAVLAFFAFVAAPGPGLAQTGVVLMHGKWGMPLPGSPIGSLIAGLRAAGFRVVAPEMPWSRDRLYDTDLAGAFREIDRAVAALRSQGARKVVVGGHSMGANVAIAYGVNRSGIAGILAIAPGHRPEVRRFVRSNAAAARAARAALARGDTSRTFAIVDYNVDGRTFTLPARIVVDYFAPDGPTVMPLNAPRLRPGTPVLWIIGREDRLLAEGRAYAFDRFPPHPRSAYLVVRGGHRATPRIGQQEIVAWLRGL